MMGVFVQVNEDSPMAKAKPIGYIICENGCWEWVGARHRDGYGSLGVGGRSFLAHKWMYERKKGLVPSGLELDHLCRKRDCVNPDHLEAVTHRVNSLRGEGVASANAVLTHCRQGHVFDEVNTYWFRPNHRMCKQCLRARGREYMRRKRAVDPNYGRSR